MKELKDKNLYYVGGVVRDEILGIASFDTDFCYEGDAIDFADRNGLNIIKRNPDFGTVRVLFDNKEIDIASTREETYPTPGHLPSVKNIGCPLKDDLKRRDFTINSIAKNTLTGELVDPFDGQHDIESKQIKILHDNSFVDDPTRIIRALKFSTRFGFKLEKNTKNLQEDYLRNINYDMSYHRLKKELFETFNLNKSKAFDEFVEQGIYKLLGDNQQKPNIIGGKIQEALDNSQMISKLSIAMIYLGFFNLNNLPLTRQEKRILEWAERLKTEKSTNNTPLESIILHSIAEGIEC